MIFVSLWIVLISSGAKGAESNFLLPWLCVPASAETAFHHPWTIITYQWVHFDILHLLFNMLWLFWFGIYLVRAVADASFLRLYIGGGVAGAIFFITANAIIGTQTFTTSYLCGASAAVLAVMTATAFRFPDTRVNLLLFGMVRLKWVAVVCILLTLLGFGGGTQGAQSAHIGGVVWGAAYHFMKGRIPGSSISFRKMRRRLMPAKNPFVSMERNPFFVNGIDTASSDSHDRLDILLDKIRISGYASLSKSEKIELNALSRKLNS